MFMKNIDFNNEDVKTKYKYLLKDHRGMSGIMTLLLFDKLPIKIISIDNNEFGTQMLINKDGENIYIYVDYLKKKIYLDNANTPYMEIYDDFPKKNVNPIGLLFKHNDRVITKKITYKLGEADDDVKYYHLEENNNHYTILISSKDRKINEDKIILKLLSSSMKYNSIREVFLAIYEEVDSRHTNIKISDSKGSIITLHNGKILNYVEYCEKDDHYDKIYMENDEFYIEKKIIEKYQDNLTSYIKKIGENNGKEKR